MIKLYNTLTKKKEEFIPVNPGKVYMYSCGPTVYDFAHIGNLKTYIVTDVLRRYLEYSGHEVKQIMNITDVGHLTADDVNQADTGEDKMLKAAKREKKTPLEIANFYTERFFEDAKKLNIEKATYYPRATMHIPQMIKIIEGLIKKGLAYEANGNVFYDITKFPGYGKLSGKKIEELKVGARLEEHTDKRHPYDFSLWLKAPKDHLMKYESPWGLGYPGWHIECSAMSMEYLGNTIDIHTGGEDHIFPHHENEIAQSEGYTGEKFSRFWFHTRFLLVDGEKMSKSKENFYTLEDIEKKGYDPMVFRLLILSSHYRSNSNFTWEAMEQAKVNYSKISNVANELGGRPIESFEGKAETINIEKYKKDFLSAMDDDLNTPLALSIFYDLITEINKKIDKLSLENTNALGKFVGEIRNILGIRLSLSATFSETIKIKDDKLETIKIPKEIKKLAEERKIVRESKDFQKSDEIREQIEKAGYIIEDLENNNYSIKKK